MDPKAERGHGHSDRKPRDICHGMSLAFYEIPTGGY
jgi:hypothetical protein